MSKILFGKQDLIYKIGKKINNSIQVRLLDDIIDLITNFICDELSENKTFSVNKFGTFHQKFKKPRLVWSNLQQKEVMSRSKREVKFSPHVVFTNLLKSKRKSIVEVLKVEKDIVDKKKI